MNLTKSNSKIYDNDKERSKKILPNITSLRFFLALFVILHHINSLFLSRNIGLSVNYSFLNKGTESVFLFFSLSGFLIIRQLYLEKIETSTISLKKFFSRRILRIFPLYYLVLFFGIFVYYFLVPFFQLEFRTTVPLFPSIWLPFTFFANIYFNLHPGGILGVLWSIGVEEQFYILIAPTLFLISQKHIKLFLIVFSALFFMLFFSNKLPLIKEYHLYFFYFTFSGFCSIIVLKYDFTKFIKYPILLFFLLFFSTSIFLNKKFPEAYHFFSMILFAFTICVLVKNPFKVLQQSQMVYLGKISFGIYMLHYPVIQGIGLLYFKFFNIQNTILLFVIFFVIVTVITILLAHLSYRYYESYFLKKRFF